MGTDDVMVLKEAMKFNCPVVSRDGFQEWKDDPRLSRDLRQWVGDMSFLQVRFSWNSNGDFVPDFDLPTPVLKPSAGKHAAWPCNLCNAQVSDGSWSRWKGKWYWSCRDCTAHWN